MYFARIDVELTYIWSERLVPSRELFHLIKPAEHPKVTLHSKAVSGAIQAMVPPFSSSVILALWGDESPITTLITERARQGRMITTVHYCCYRCITLANRIFNYSAATIL